MDIHRIKRSTLALLLSMLLPATAMSVEPDQLLDRVHGSNNAVVLDLQFDSLDFSVVIPPQDDDDFDFNFNFDACTITAINGLWCLSDGIDIFHWRIQPIKMCLSENLVVMIQR